MSLRFDSKRLVLAALVALVSTACKESEPKPIPIKPPPDPIAAIEVPPPGLEKGAWTARSRDYKVTVQQMPSAPGQCVVKSSSATDGWSVNTCLGDNTLLYFASADGTGLLVIDPFPAFERTWQTAPVVRLYTRGELTAFTNAGALVNQRQKLRMSEKRFAWLQGTGGLPGAPPKYVLEDVLEGTTADGARMRLGFNADSIPKPMNSTEVVANEVLESGGVLSWTDEKGETHFTNDPRRVPGKFRTAAERKIDGGMIGVMREK